MLRRITLVVMAIALSGCGREAPGSAPTQVTTAPSPSALTNTHDHDHDHGHEAAPVGAGERLAASLITVAYADVESYASRRPKPGRSKAEALARARELMVKARRDPSLFSDLARESSEDPFAPNGGELGTWTSGNGSDMDSVVAALAIGQISEPVESEYGYRIVRRDPPLPDEKISARHLVVAFAGATRAPSTQARTKGDARARAEELAARARQDPGGFEALIKTESDGWDKGKGGALGVWTMNGKRYPAVFDRAIHALPPGGLSGPVESEFGYHIFQRLAVGEAPSAQLAGAHILIAFEGAEKARPGVRRSKDEALAEASRLVELLRGDPSQFTELARTRSDDSATGANGGQLGSFRKGTMPRAFEEAMERLSAGEIGGPVLTQYGYHVLLRREAPTEKEYVSP